MSPLMKSFLFSACSVRLGTIITGVSSIIQAVIPLCILLLNGSGKLKQAARYTRKNIIDNMLLNYLENDSDVEMLFMGIVIGIVSYILSCLLMIFGAFKLFKWLLVPYIVLEFGRFVILFTVHVVGMMVLKKQLNLGILIGATVLGGFGLLFVLYMWACVVALFQIIGIINSKTYKLLFGENGSVVTLRNIQERIVNDGGVGGTSNGTIGTAAIASVTRDGNGKVQLYQMPDNSSITPEKKIGSIKNKMLGYDRKNGYNSISIISGAVNEPNGLDANMFNRDFLSVTHRYNVRQKFNK